MRSLLLLVALLVCGTAFAHPFTDCSKPGDAFKVNSVTLSPDPPMKGSPENITMAGVVTGSIPGGSVVLTITYVPLNLKVFSQNYNLCDLTPCPSTGPVSGSLIIPASAIPSFAPAGQYQGVGLFTDNTGAEIACVQTTFNL